MSAGDAMIEAIADAVAERLDKMNCRRKRLVQVEYKPDPRTGERDED
jgi:hypothetical protein